MGNLRKMERGDMKVVNEFTGFFFFFFFFSNTFLVPQLVSTSKIELTGVGHQSKKPYNADRSQKPKNLHSEND